MTGESQLLPAEAGSSNVVVTVVDINLTYRNFKIFGRSRLLTVIGNTQRCAYAYRQQELAPTSVVQVAEGLT